MRARPRRPGHDTRLMLLALAGAGPGAAVALVLIWTGEYPPRTQWTLTLLIVGVAWGCAAALRHRVVFPLQTLSNLLASLREGDASIRARGAGRIDALGEVMLEANALAETVRQQRLDALEATTLLRKVMAEIEVAVFALDSEQRVLLANRAGERLLGQPAERLLGARAADVGLAPCLGTDVPRVLDIAFPGGIGRWEVRHSTFRQSGLPRQLLVLSDVSQPLRDEERQAWARLMRVLGHEINNSLAPIKSLAGSLEHLVGQEPPPPDWRDDMRQGLAVIAARAEALGRFTQAYARLARLPRPKLRRLEVADMIQRVGGLERRVPVRIEDGPPVAVQGDRDQLEQLLINLVGNASDAARETGGGIALGWRLSGGQVEIRVEDEGPGLPDPANLFVPFFTTKAGGSGIGLVISRQIAEAHGGALLLENRTDRPGCRARLLLPLAAADGRLSAAG